MEGLYVQIMFSLTCSYHEPRRPQTTRKKGRFINYPKELTNKDNELSIEPQFRVLWLFKFLDPYDKGCSMHIDES